MRLAVIDLGTNSVRFDVHQIDAKNKIQILHREKIMVKLGQGVFTYGRLNDEAIKRTLHAFKGFHRLCDDLSVQRVVAFGTSALREASDGEQFVEKVKDLTGIEVRIISGREEARLIARGVLSDPKLKQDRVGLIDIGGGSTELSISHRNKLVFSESFALGTARLQQLFFKKTPPTPEQVRSLRAYIRDQIDLHKPDLKIQSRLKTWVGSSGTIRAIDKILKKSTENKSLKKNDKKSSKKDARKKGISFLALAKLNREMATMTLDELQTIDGMELRRVEMIFAGSLLLEELMHIFEIERVMVTELSLRDGILNEQKEIINKHLGSQIALHMGDLVEKAARFGVSAEHSKAELVLAAKLFNSLTPIHGLGPSWRLFLEAALILRNVGEAISPVGHPDHTYYVIRNARFPFAEDWEIEMVAQLSRFHEVNKLAVDQYPFPKNHRISRVFERLLALLLILDSISLSREDLPIMKSIRLESSKMRLTFSGGTSSGLEQLRFEQRRAWVEKILKRTIVLKSV